MPDLIADVLLYATAKGGKAGPALPGYGCPCMISTAEPLIGYDARLLLADKPFYPGEQRQVGFRFLSKEAVAVMLTARRFFLWEGRFVGEATVVISEEDD